jgi:hypothetical protein
MAGRAMACAAKEVATRESLTLNRGDYAAARPHERDGRCGTVERRSVTRFGVESGADRGPRCLYTGVGYAGHSPDLFLN